MTPSVLLAPLVRGTSALVYSDLGVLGGALGAFVGGALRVRRAHVEGAMARAGVAEPTRTAAGMYGSLGTSALELLWLAGERRDLRSLVRVDPDAEATLAHARATGRGVVLAASHTGNWDLAACAIASSSRLAPPEHGMSLMVVTKHLSMGWLDAFWQRTRARYGVELVSARGAFARGRDHVRAGGAVAMMIDQVPARRAHACQVAFLGQTAWVDKAPATLAARTGALLVVPCARRDSYGVQQLGVMDVIEPPASATNAWIADATTRATGALERFVLENPTEWLWMHRRWATPKAA